VEAEALQQRSARRARGFQARESLSVRQACAVGGRRRVCAADQDRHLGDSDAPREGTNDLESVTIGDYLPAAAEAAGVPRITGALSARASAVHSRKERPIFALAGKGRSQPQIAYRASGIEKLCQQVSRDENLRRSRSIAILVFVECDQQLRLSNIEFGEILCIWACALTDRVRWLSEALICGQLRDTKVRDDGQKWLHIRS
jgi:hypothetical protein